MGCSSGLFLPLSEGTSALSIDAGTVGLLLYQAGVGCTLHQLQHLHATKLINGGVSLPTIRKRLGHKNLQTTFITAHSSYEEGNKINDR